MFEGGGKYIGRDGKASELPATARSVELPPDALPSSSEFDRHLEAITISEGKRYQNCLVLLTILELNQLDRIYG